MERFWRLWEEEITRRLRKLRKPVNKAIAAILVRERVWGRVKK